MKDRILKLWLLFLHTCMFNTFSIVAGSMLTFAWIAWLSLYFPLITTLLICPLLTFIIYLSIVLLSHKMTDITDSYEFQSNTFGILLGCLWVIFLAFI